MTPQEAKTLLEQNGYKVEAAGVPYRTGFFKITGLDGNVDVVSSEQLVQGATALQAEIAKARPKGWPSETPWPPMKVERVGTDPNTGDPIYDLVPDYAALNAALQEQRLSAGAERFPLPAGQPRTIEEGGQVYSWDSTTGDYKRVSEVAQGQGPTEQFLGTVEEGGWQIDQYGYTDAQGKTVITARQPRAPIKDPILSIDDMIAQALSKVTDLNALDDPGVQKAQALYDFKTQVERRQLNHTIAMDRLDKALQIAQSPSDYLTLVALYTGALERDNPALVGERIAPLAQILQQQAMAFFLDIPGINTVPPYTPPVAPPVMPPQTALDVEKAADQQGIIRPPTDIEEGIETPLKPTAPLTPQQITGLEAGPYNDATPTLDIQPGETWEEWLQRTGKADPFAPSAQTPLTEVQAELSDDELLQKFYPELVQMGSMDPRLREKLIAEARGITAPVVEPSGVRFGETPGVSNRPEGWWFDSESGQWEPPVETGTPMTAAVAEPSSLGKPPTVMQSVAAAKQSPAIPSGVQRVEAGPQLPGNEPSTLGTVGKFLQSLADEEDKKKNRNIPEFQTGGIVPGYPGQQQLASVEGGEAVLTPQQTKALLGQTGLFGPTYQVPPQQLPEFLRRPRTTSLSQLTGGALRPRSLQTIRNQSPTARALTIELAKSFGVPKEDYLEEERLATSIGGPRRMTRFAPTTIRTGR